ncbi:GcrA family cell cycle regulator [Rhizobium rhizogenes]|uniref:GcrA family cell cycle regulator n=1 Tax=Rhizobium rhizogenes TaxID=359 RepID=UPI0004D9BE93|nr:GcrA family cell cycle regulator [Rhizobium rhizogenes]KEA07148.1 hypothetical protein CN09_09390 [Rhizobium rhizogenes]NTI80416.1 hypothetical protein [Rhizobium rhizogenes]NTJ22602.1 hypothetical protein [Rhizobium rhizogenes]QUE81308.1 hypothetical protein EML492_05730 [Rhizobium rhizogenes]TQO80594.1 hypothetical protein FFE80_05695 [Rhizobium rhizogenes]
MDGTQYFKWTDETMQTAADMWSKGHSGTEIAEKIGVSRNSMLGMADRNRERFPSRLKRPSPHLGVKKNKPRLEWTGERLMKSAALWARNTTIPDMAKIMDVSRSAMFDAVKRYPHHFPERVRPNSGTNARAAALVRRADREGKANERADRGFDSSQLAFPGARSVRFVDLTTQQCKFPISRADEASDADMPCCGIQAEDGRPYCTFHHRLAYRPREMVIGGGQRA